MNLWSLEMIVLQYVYELSKALRQRHEQQKNSSTILKEWKLAWCDRVVDHANDWNSDVLINLLTTGMLRMRFEERLSADVCLTKECDLGFFDDHSLDSKSVTLTRQTTLQSEISDDDDSITILLDALWNMKKKSLNHDDNNRIKRCTFEHTSEVLKLLNLQASSSSSNEDDQDSQLRSCGTALDHLNDNVQSSANLLCSLEIRSIYSEEYKRQRSSTVNSTNNSFDKTRIKRRSSEVHLKKISVSHAFQISNWCLEQVKKSNQFRTMYDAVLALLTNLLRKKSQDIDIDDRTSILIEESSDHLTRLEIIEMRITRNDLSDQVIVVTDLDCRKIVIVSLTSFDLMSSVADLIAHLLQMLQLQNSRSASTSTMLVNDSSLREYIIRDDIRSQNWTFNSVDSHMSISIVRQYGLIYSSALLNNIKISSCFISI